MSSSFLLDDIAVALIGGARRSQKEEKRVTLDNSHEIWGMDFEVTKDN